MNQKKGTTSKDDPVVPIKGSAKSKSFQDLLQHSKGTGNNQPGLKGLKTNPPDAKILSGTRKEHWRENYSFISVALDLIVR